MTPATVPTRYSQNIAAIARFRCRAPGTGNAVISIAVLLLLAAVNLAAGLKYPPLFANTVALVFLTVVAWREMHAQKEPEN